MLLFPNFQRSSGSLAIPLFQADCKGKGLYYITKNFLLFFNNFFVKKQPIVFWRTCDFFYADGKDTTSILITKLLPLFFSKSFIHFIRLIYLVGVPPAKNYSWSFSVIPDSFRPLSDNFLHLPFFRFSISYQPSISNRVAKISSCTSPPNIFWIIFVNNCWKPIL